MRVDENRLTATYMLSNRKHGTLYLGSALARDREYEMKKWRRDWKINLIERDNPDWEDLFPTLIGAPIVRARNKP